MTDFIRKLGAGMDNGTLCARLGLANCRQPQPDIITGGVPSIGDLLVLRQAGLQTVVDLRTASEWQAVDFPGKVEEAGMVFRHLPVDGAAGLDESTTLAFWQLWTDPRLKPMLVHCASGNRVGAAVALAARRHGGLEPASALDLGLRAGLAASEAQVRSLIQLPVAGDDGYPG